MVSASVGALGYFLSAFAPSFGILCVSFGVMGGKYLILTSDVSLNFLIMYFKTYLEIKGFS